MSQYLTLLRRSTLRVCLPILVSVFCVTSANAATITIGTLSFNEFFPGLNTFSVGNLTGPNAAPPDYPVVTALDFTSSNLHIEIDGGITTDALLLTVGPGSTGAGLFLSSALNVVSAQLTATLPAGPWQLANGDTFTPWSSALVINLGPFGAGFLLVDDVVPITVDGTITAPEPASALLLLAGAGAAALRRRTRRA